MRRARGSQERGAQQGLSCWEEQEASLGAAGRGQWYHAVPSPCATDRQSDTEIVFNENMNADCPGATVIG